ncbi:MAG: flagellar hook-associated protein FlgK [Burkholderiaceae bacterium]|nr:MAG: flagellar hook-associated protein FlgK [Burkholderiaceae bacterium]
MSSILQTALTGLTAARYGLDATTHNITNSNTDGYSRQQIVQSTNNPEFTGAGFMGRGVNVNDVRRVYDGLLTRQVQSAQAGASYFSSYQAQINQVDNTLSDATAGLTPALADFFAVTQDVAAHPSDIASRQGLLSGAQSLVARFQAIDSRLNDLRLSTNAQMQTSVTNINTYTSEIANLNQRISELTNSGTIGQAPNDLLDQRDLLIKQLNQEVATTTVAVPDGTVSVFLANGQAMVVGNRASTLSAAQDPADPSQLRVGLVVGASVMPFRAADLAGGGALGGYLAFRDNTLNPARDSLGLIGINLASAFNLQHTAGRDLNGAVGGNFFNVPVPIVISNAGNAGSGAVTATIASATALTSDDYKLLYDGTNFQLTNLTTNVTTTYATLPQTVNGVTINISGAPSANDSFLIQPTRDGARTLSAAITDTRLIAAAAPNISTAVGGGNTGTGAVSSSVIAIPAAAGFDYSTPVQIRFTSPTNYELRTGSPGFATVASTGVLGGAGTVTYNGWTVTLTGTPAAADTFTVSFAASGPGDNRNAVALGNLQNTQMVGGTASLQDTYSQLVSTVGSKAHEIQVSGKAQDTLLQNTVTAQQSVSGVNLDEEASNLLRYQQAYSAAGRAVAIAGQLFQDILDIAKAG